MERYPAPKTASSPSERQAPQAPKKSPSWEEVFSALAEPTCRAIFMSLRHEALQLCDIALQVHADEHVLTSHVNSLLEAGLLTQWRQGKHVYYRANRGGLAPLRLFLAYF
jgi:DNA-binding transcriptional ArsR family regulator